MISAFQKFTFFKLNHQNFRKKSLIGRKGFSFDYILGCEACELHFCILRLYCKHFFFLFHKHLTGSHITEFVFFAVMLIFWSVCSCKCQNMVLQVSVNHTSGHLIELNATELKISVCGKPIVACSFIGTCLS